MDKSTSLAPELTQRKVTLWVEDALTREYLLTVWQSDAKILDVRVGGGHETIRATVHDLRSQGVGNVFGLTDRDFGPTNRPQWGNPASGLEVFRLESFEVENLLLDWDALEGCKLNRDEHARTTPEIRTKAEAYAQTMLWWMACCRVMADYRGRLIADFPEHPKVANVRSLADAQNYLQQNPWLPQVAPAAAHITSPANVATDLNAAQVTASQAVAAGSWLQTFSGKEVFRHLRGWMYDVSGGSPSEKDTDLVKSVGEWQVTNDRVPQELLDLKTALKTRTGV